MNIFALITLKLDHLAHFRVTDDRSITRLSIVSECTPHCLSLPQHTELLLDNLKDFLLIELFGKSLDGCQSLTTISLLDADVDVIPLGILRFPSVVVGLREGVCERWSVSYESLRAGRSLKKRLIAGIFDDLVEKESSQGAIAEPLRQRCRRWVAGSLLLSTVVARGGLKEGLGLPKVLRFWIVDINSSVSRNGWSRKVM